MPPLKIAIIGCGIAGSCSAIMLRRQGHDVHIFEQAAELKPVGAGVMLQPLGQAVLDRIGLLSKVIPHAEPIHELHAVYRSGRTMIKMPFTAARIGKHAYGVHRGDIFDVLLDEVQHCNIPVTLNLRIAKTVVNHQRVAIQGSNGELFDGFDHVLVANGSKCGLRRRLGFRSTEIDYDYAAIWCSVRSDLVRNQLLQIVEGTTKLMGILPVGNGRTSLFWGLACRDREHCMGQPIESWKEELCRFYPAAREVIAAIPDWTCATYGTYRRASVAPLFDARHVFLGDAAHATSPHLGQGLNFALFDAFRFASNLERSDSWIEAGQRFVAQQRDHSRYYRFVTALLTPFFQSDSLWRGTFRDSTLPWLHRVPIIRGQMALTMTGMKSGFLKGAVRW